MIATKFWERWECKECSWFISLLDFKGKFTKITKGKLLFSQFVIFTTKPSNFFLSTLAKYQIWGHSYPFHSHNSLAWIFIVGTLSLAKLHHRRPILLESRSKASKISKINAWNLKKWLVILLFTLLLLCCIVGIGWDCIMIGCNSINCCN